MKKAFSTILGCILTVAFAGTNASASPRYLSLEQRLAGQELTTAEAAKLLAGVKKPLYDSKDKSAFAVCNMQENTYLDIERTVLNPFFASIQSGDFSKAESYVEKGYKIHGSFFSKKSSEQGFDIYAWNSESDSSLKSLFSEFHSLESLNNETLLAKFGDEKTPAHKMQSALLKVELEIRGKKTASQKVQAIGYMEIRVVKTKGAWKIQNLSVRDGQSVASAMKPSFRLQNNKEIFNAPLNVHLRSEAIRRGGYGLSVNDYNGDGSPDLYVGNVGKSQAFTNDGKGKFSFDAKVPQDDLVKSVAFADFDNDGLQDLLVIRFVSEESKNSISGSTAVTVYKNMGNGKFEKIKTPVEDASGAHDLAMPGALADFDNDGMLDFYIGYPGALDFTHSKAKKDLNSHGLYFGNKSGTFDSLPAEGFRSSFATLRQGFPHSALAVDYNNDGLSDVLVVDDRAGLSPAFTNLGGRKFEQEAKEIGLGNEGYGMHIAAADINGDGILDLVLSNVETAASERITASCMENEDRVWKTMKEKPLRIFIGTADKGFMEADARQWGLGHPGYGLSGVRFLDYDNDGQIDLYVTNGLWSGDDKDQKFDSYFARSHTFEDINGTQASLERSLKNRPQSVYMDILSFFKGDIFGADKKSNSRPSLAGFQRNRLYKKIGSRFVDVAYLEGVDSIADGYMAASADLNGDGKLELILRNADPGSKEAIFEPVEIFSNIRGEENQSLTLRLVGTTSNADAIGAKVFVTVDGKTQMQHLIGLDGTIQSSKQMHFGLGNTKSKATVRVVWPSGKETIQKGVKPGILTITEK